VFRKESKANLHNIFVYSTTSFQVSRLSGAHLRIFIPGCSLKFAAMASHWKHNDKLHFHKHNVVENREPTSFWS